MNRSYVLSDRDVDWLVYLLGVAARAAQQPLKRGLGEAGPAGVDVVVAAAETAALRLAGELRSQQARV